MTEGCFLTVWEAANQAVCFLLRPLSLSLLALQMVTFSLCPHVVFSQCVLTPGVSASSYKGTNSIGLGPLPYDLI